MGVTVQLMVDAEISGVMFTCNPVSGDPSMVAINASWGLGLAVVGGEVTPDDFLVSKVTGELVREHVHAKDVQYVPDAGGQRRGPRRGPRRAARRRAVWTSPRSSAWSRWRVGSSATSGRHQDIEWALARGDPEALFVVQARPVTAVPRSATEPKAQSAMSLIMSTFGAGRAATTDDDGR